MFSQSNSSSHQLMPVMPDLLGSQLEQTVQGIPTVATSDNTGYLTSVGVNHNDATSQGSYMNWGSNMDINHQAHVNNPQALSHDPLRDQGFFPQQTHNPSNIPNHIATSGVGSWPYPTAMTHTSDTQDYGDDQDIFQLAKQIANQNNDSFGYSQVQDSYDDPLSWNTLSNIPQTSTAGLYDLGSDFEDISKEQLLPISSSVQSLVPSSDHIMSPQSALINQMQPLRTMSIAQTSYDQTQALYPAMSTPQAAGIQAQTLCPTSSMVQAADHQTQQCTTSLVQATLNQAQPCSTTSMAQAAHIDGIKSMFRLLDLPSSDISRNNEQGPVSELDTSLKKDVACTVDSDKTLGGETATTFPSRRPAKFHIDKSKLHEVSLANQSSELAGLGLTVYNQAELEQDIIAQANDAMEAEEHEKKKILMQKELNAVKDDIKSCLMDLQKAEQVLDMLKGGKNSMNKSVKRRIISVRNQMDQKLKQLDKLRAKKKSILNGNIGLDDSVQKTSKLSSNEVAMQAMIGFDVDDKMRRGEMTPFGTVMDFAKNKKEPEKKKPTKVFLSEDSPFDKYLLDQQSRSKKVSATVTKSSTESKEPKQKKKQKSSKKNVQLRSSDEGNIFDAKDKRRYRPCEKDFSNHRPNKRSSFSRLSHNFSGDGQLSDHECGDEDEMYDEHLHNDDDEYVPDMGELPDSDDHELTDKKEPKSQRKLKRKLSSANVSNVKKKSKSGSLDKLNCRDDGDLEAYKARLNAYCKANAKMKYDKIQNGEADSEDESDVELDGGFMVPARIWNKLYSFQKTGVRWLWELHGQEAGGIVGDEMGLGKTIQVAAFLAGLAHSNLKDNGSEYRGLGPSVIVVPTTVMHQWVKELHKWAPKFRVAVLHNTGSYKSSEESLVYSVFKNRGVLITAYSSVVIYQELLLRYDWHYLILDEGHKIRNPDAQITVACKQFRTCHRIILSGSPIQNNLKELWSLFDFVFPGKLGTLPEFMNHVSTPIIRGGYANATKVQVEAAFKTATVLRDTIRPYLLRRMKSDVKENLQLPEKNEQVLFCSLTEHQKSVYQEYLDSRECQEILSGNFMAFPGLITLRKICNHPDLSTGGVSQFDQDYNEMSAEEKDYGYPGRSGKMMVVQSLLKLWHKQGHRVLLFSQGTQMLNILESQVKSEGYSYMRMDGTTSIGARQGMVDKFNNTPEMFVFLLTTRVGGLGVNLCGANRVLLFDPDWNPSTDTQARERAWRIGQSRQVTIYRLLTAGTIEEKIYHRQIFKQFLTNRVLKDPKQRRFFKSNDLFELFTLSCDDQNHGTETSAIFAGTGSNVTVKARKSSKGKKDKSKKNRFDQMKARGDDTNLEIDCDEEEKKSKELQERLEKMREFARKISKQLEKEKQEKEKLDQAKESAPKVEQAEEGEITESVDATIETTKKSDEEAPSSVDTTSTKHKHKKHRKDKKSKKRKREKRKDAVFEGETISHLAKHSTYKSAETEDENKKKDDDYVLECLFKKSNVHSALQHDTIMMSSNPDYVLVEEEAERVAKEAADALRKSRTRCHSARTGIPTWTGQSGKTISLTQQKKPRFGQKKNTLVVNSSKPKEEKAETKTKAKQERALFDGTMAGSVRIDTTGSATLTVMSSSDLMQRMRKRNFYSRPVNSGEQEDEAHEVNEETMDFITDIRNFIAFQSEVNGQASTQELLKEFSSKIPSSDSAKFKAMLKEICEFLRIEGKGMWRLRSEFR